MIISVICGIKIVSWAAEDRQNNDLFSKVRDQYLHAYSDQYQAAKKFWLHPAAYLLAEAASQLKADDAEQKGHQADDGQRQ